MQTAEMVPSLPRHKNQKPAVHELYQRMLGTRIHLLHFQLKVGEMRALLSAAGEQAGIFLVLRVCGLDKNLAPVTMG